MQTGLHSESMSSPVRIHMLQEIILKTWKTHLAQKKIQIATRGYLSQGKLDIKINYCKVAQPFQLLFFGIASLKMS